MKQYDVVFFETVRHTLTVEAQDKSEAITKASDAFYEGWNTKEVRSHEKETIDNEYVDIEEVKEQ